MSEPVIIIGGGVGPMAGVMLHKKIIEATKSDSGDEGHLSVIHISRSARIPDRTRFLLDHSRDPEHGGNEPKPNNPGLAMAAVFAEACRSLTPGERAVGGVPCNTFHAPVIFQAFLAELRRLNAPVRIVNMEEAAVKFIRSGMGKRTGARIGVLSTTGTRMIGLFDSLFESMGWGVVYIPEREQARLHEAIYHPEWGLKSVSPPSSRAAGVVCEMADMLVCEGVDYIIPGCTELPFVLSAGMYKGIPVIDPVQALAVSLVEEAAPGKSGTF